MYLIALVVVFLVLLLVFMKRESFVCEGGKTDGCLCWQESMEGGGPQAISVGPIGTNIPLNVSARSLPCPRRTDEELLRAAMGLDSHANGITYF